MKFFVTSLLLLASLTATASAQNRFEATQLFLPSGQVIEVGPVSEHMLYETKSQWIMVACGDDRTLQGSGNKALFLAKADLAEMLVIVAKDPAQVEWINREQSYRLRENHPSQKTDLDLLSYGVQKDAVQKHDGIYTTCLAVAAGKERMPLDYVRTHGTLEYLK